jgi:hypothetical protein
MCRLALRHGSMNPLFQVAFFLPEVGHEVGVVEGVAVERLAFDGARYRHLPRHQHQVIRLRALFEHQVTSTLRVSGYAHSSSHQVHEHLPSQLPKDFIMQTLRVHTLGYH